MTQRNLTDAAALAKLLPIALLIAVAYVTVQAPMTFLRDRPASRLDIAAAAVGVSFWILTISAVASLL